MTYAQKQKRVFSKLVDISYKLSDWYRTQIEKTTLGDFLFTIYDSRHTTILNRVIFPWKLKNTAEINAAINEVWEAIPEECKKSPDPETERKRRLKYLFNKP